MRGFPFDNVLGLSFLLCFGSIFCFRIQPKLRSDDIVKFLVWHHFRSSFGLLLALFSPCSTLQLLNLCLPYLGTT